jgi:HSP20 family protein
MRNRGEPGDGSLSSLADAGRSMPGMSGPSRRWDPFGEFQREVGRLFESLNSPRAWRTRAYPALNLYETEDAYVITAEAPGMDLASLDLSLTGETLTIRGERKRAEAVAEESYRRQERPFGRWSRSLTLPGRLDGARVAAHYANGILTVTLPKAEEARPRQIAVTTAP